MGILNNEYNEWLKNGGDPETPPHQEAPEEATDVAAAEPEQQPSHTFSANTEPAQATQERPAAATPDRRTFAQTVQRRTRNYIAGLALGAAIIGGAVAHAASKTHSEPPHPHVGSSAPIDPSETSPSVDPSPTETTTEVPATTTTPELPAETTGPLAKYEQETTEEFFAHPVPEHLFYSYTKAERVTDDLILSDWFMQKFPGGEILGEYLPPIKPLDATSDGVDIARQAAANKALALAWKVNEDAPIGPDFEDLNYAVAEKLAMGATLSGSKAYYELDKYIKDSKWARPMTDEELAFTVTSTSPLISTNTAYDNVNLKGKVLTVEFAPDAEHPEKRVYKDTYAYVPNGYGEGKNAYLLASHELQPSAK